jgi:hypothetical protein
MSGPPGVSAGDLEPPLEAVDETGKPVPTMTSLDEMDAKLDDIYELIGQVCLQCIDAGVPATGQKASYGTGDDGFYEKGVIWPEPRFTDKGDGTVKDELTGLIWLKDADCIEAKVWSDALTTCNSLADGQCGLRDDSEPGDWHLPNVRQLHSLVDFSRSDPALPAGHLFTDFKLGSYWSSTSYARNTGHAWRVSMFIGLVNSNSKDNLYYVLPVRSGN